MRYILNQYNDKWVYMLYIHVHHPKHYCIYVIDIYIYIRNFTKTQVQYACVNINILMYNSDINMFIYVQKIMKTAIN